VRIGISRHEAEKTTPQDRIVFCKVNAMKAYPAVVMRTGLALSIALCAFAEMRTPVHAQNSSQAQTQQSSAAIFSLEGNVREVFLNRFIFESGGMRYLVEPDGAAGTFFLTQDERLTVNGRRYETLVQASRIARNNGEILYDKASAAPVAIVAPPPKAAPQNHQATQALSILDTVAGLDLQPVGEAVRKKHHIEILAKMKDGRSVFVSFDLAGKLWEIEDADYDHHKVSQEEHLSEQRLFKVANDASFRPIELIERRRHYAIVSAKNRRDEIVNLHIDFAGYIYKQVWPR
jgi:hypothetical protein